MKMKLLAVGMLLLVNQAFAGASGALIENFSIFRSGGGSVEVVVEQQGQQIVAYTKSCGKQLSPAEQNATLFTVSGQAATDATTIFENTEVLAANSSIHTPYWATGTWVSMVVNYSYNPPIQGPAIAGQQTIKAPIVLINYQISPVLSEIETQARAANRTVCN
jgi:hypothetical protein